MSSATYVPELNGKVSTDFSCILDSSMIPDRQSDEVEIPIQNWLIGSDNKLIARVKIHDLKEAARGFFQKESLPVGIENVLNSEGYRQAKSDDENGC